jgi:hypothetical protein
MAEKACHGFGSTAQVGLTQVLGVTAGSFSAVASSVTYVAAYRAARARPSPAPAGLLRPLAPASPSAWLRQHGSIIAGPSSAACRLAGSGQSAGRPGLLLSRLVAGWPSWRWEVQPAVGAAPPNKSFKPNATSGVGLIPVLGVTAESVSALASSVSPSQRAVRRGSGLHRLRLVSSGHLPRHPRLLGFGSTAQSLRGHLRRHVALPVPGKAPVGLGWYCFGWRRVGHGWLWELSQLLEQHRLTSHSSRTPQVASA